MSNAHAYPHEPTGVETRKLGMWVFLSTEILFFGTLITTFMIFMTYQNLTQIIQNF